MLFSRLKSDYVWYFICTNCSKHLIIFPLPFHFHKGLHRAYILLAYHFKDFHSFNIFYTFYDNCKSRSGVWGLGSAILYYVVHFNCHYGLFYYILCVTNPGGREDWFRSRPTTSIFSISLTNHKHSPLTFNGLLTYNSYSRSITV